MPFWQPGGGIAKDAKTQRGPEVSVRVVNDETAPPMPGILEFVI